MGVPKFFRWLSERYPLINISAGEGGINIPEFDCLYLDMNGIIHNCSHPSDTDYCSTLSERDIMLGVFKYIDKIVQVVKPRQLLYMAIDGVAPRAKMNQQRSRRFRSARDAAARLEELREEKGPAIGKNVFDSNCITPGTPFMVKLDQHLRSFIRKKLKEDEAWKRFKVIYSGHATPGEGEHKIMEYIRAQRSRPGWKPNLRHCVYGLDADLMMLGLVTHEPHFALLREEIDFTSFQRNKNATKTVQKQTQRVKWQLLSLTILREYLHRDFAGSSPPDFYDQEKVIDDFVLMCMLCGNDFIPHLPTLDIGEDAITFLMDTYKRLLRTKMGGFICDSGSIHWGRFQMLLEEVGTVEDKVFRERETKRKKILKRKARDDYAKKKAERTRKDQELQNELAAKLQGQDSFKNRYYLSKFGFAPTASVADSKQGEIRDALCREYLRGLSWVMQYYYGGCASWGWFFPFHYAPLASDLKPTSMTRPQDLDTFVLGKPFNPFQQLLGCLPPSGAKFLPKPYRFLMTDADSSIADFYPDRFEVDMNGAHNPWEGVNLLPFIDEARLNKAMNGLLDKCSDDEKLRATPKPPVLCVHDQGRHEPYVCSMPESWGFGTLKECHSRFDVMPPESHTPLKGPRERFTPALYPGTLIRSPGFPSLMHMQLEFPGKFEAVEVNLHGYPSRKETLVLESKAKQSNGIALDASAKQVADSILGKSVFVGWPMLREALVVAVAGPDGTYKGKFTTLKDGSVPPCRSISFTRHSKAKKEHFLKSLKHREILWLKGREKLCGKGGVRCRRGGRIILHIRLVKSVLVNQSTGSTRKSYEENEEIALGSMVLLRHPAPDTRLVDGETTPLERRFPRGHPVLCLQPGALFGATGKVVDIDVSSKKVKAAMWKRRKYPPFGFKIIQGVKNKYTSVLQLARKYSIEYGTLLKLMSAVPVVEGRGGQRRRHFGGPRRPDDRTDVGLNFKIRNDLVVPGIMRSQTTSTRAAVTKAWKSGDSVKKIGGGGGRGSDHRVAFKWEITDEAIGILKTYLKTFPMIAHVVASNPAAHEYRISDIFGAGAAGQKKLEEFLEWKKSIRCFGAPLVPVSSITMPTEAIKACEKALDVLTKHDEGGKEITTKTMRVSDLIPAVTNTWMEPMQLFEGGRTRALPNLGERVANIGSTRVPFGLRGLVVAVHPRTRCVEIIFDKYFVGGTTLSGICTNGRGILLPWKMLLSLSASGAAITTSRPTAAARSSNGTVGAEERSGDSMTMEQIALNTRRAMNGGGSNATRYPRAGIVPSSVVEDASKQKQKTKPAKTGKKVRAKREDSAATPTTAIANEKGGGGGGIHASLRKFLAPVSVKSKATSLSTSPANGAAVASATHDLAKTLGVGDGKKHVEAANTLMRALGVSGGGDKKKKVLPAKRKVEAAKKKVVRDPRESKDSVDPPMPPKKAADTARRSETSVSAGGASKPKAAMKAPLELETATGETFSVDPLRFWDGLEGEASVAYEAKRAERRRRRIEEQKRRAAEDGGE